MFRNIFEPKGVKVLDTTSKHRPDPRPQKYKEPYIYLERMMEMKNKRSDTEFLIPISNEELESIIITLIDRLDITPKCDAAHDKIIYSNVERINTILTVIIQNYDSALAEIKRLNSHESVNAVEEEIINNMIDTLIFIEEVLENNGTFVKSEDLEEHKKKGKQ